MKSNESWDWSGPDPVSGGLQMQEKPKGPSNALVTRGSNKSHYGQMHHDELQMGRVSNHV